MPSFVPRQPVVSSIFTTIVKQRHYYTSVMSQLNIHTKYKMNSGFEIPALGFGVYMIPPSATEKAVLEAFKNGYRHVDSAMMYRNEKQCGRAILNSGIDRGQLFFTTKITPTYMGYENAKKAVNLSLRESGLDYIDLILIHAPYGGKEARTGTWRALVEAQKVGKIRSIGISNYGVHHLNELEEYIKGGGGGEISVGQYELHPWLDRSDIVKWLQERNVVIEAYAPLARGTRFRDPLALSMAKKYGKSPAQILVRWGLQNGFVPLPKSVTPQRIKENVDVFGFALSEDDVQKMHTGEYSPTDWDPTVDFD